MGQGIFSLFFFKKKGESFFLRAASFSPNLSTPSIFIFIFTFASDGFRVFLPNVLLNSLLEGLHGKSLTVFGCTVLCRVSRVAGGVISDLLFLSFLLIFPDDIHIWRGGMRVGVNDSSVVFREGNLREAQRRMNQSQMIH